MPTITRMYRTGSKRQYTMELDCGHKAIATNIEVKASQLYVGKRVDCTACVAVYALRAGTPYSLDTLPALAKLLGVTNDPIAGIAARYKTLGFTVTGLPSFDCATELLVLYVGALPPTIEELGDWTAKRIRTKIADCNEVEDRGEVKIPVGWTATIGQRVGTDDGFPTYDVVWDDGPDGSMGSCIWSTNELVAHAEVIG